MGGWRKDLLTKEGWANVPFIYFYMYILERNGTVREVKFKTTDAKSYISRQDKIEHHNGYQALYLEKPDKKYATDRLVNGIEPRKRGK